MSDDLKDYAGNDEGFRRWLKTVDNILTAQTGIGVLDLADMNYRDAYDDEVTAREMAGDVLDENGFPGGDYEG